MVGEALDWAGFDYDFVIGDGHRTHHDLITGVGLIAMKFEIELGDWREIYHQFAA
jgi:hypothetical protein